MEDKTFQTLWAAAFGYDDREAYVAENEEALVKTVRSKEKRQELLGKIWHVAHISIRDMIAEAGYNQSSFACHFCIPLRTVQNWCNDVNKLPPYVKLGFARQLGML